MGNTNNCNASKGNQRDKFGQLIEYNMRNIFLEKLYSKCGEETSRRPFSKKSKLHIFLGQQPKNFIQFVFIVGQVEGYRNILS